LLFITRYYALRYMLLMRHAAAFAAIFTLPLTLLMLPALR